MRRPYVIKSRHLGQSSDLTLFAPLKQGMAGSLESLTYKSRTKRLLEALHTMRGRSHEHAYMRLISDAVERVAVIQSVRVAVIEPQDMVLLSVSFDGNWESYLRVLWSKVGALLDLIFCNTEGYVDARLNRFEDWAAWVRRVQIETSFFYAPPSITARDLIFQRRQERRRHALPATDARDLAEFDDSLPTAEKEAASLGADPDLNPPVAEYSGFAVQLQQGLRGAAALYRLTDLYLPGSADGDRLRRAAIELLREFVENYLLNNYDPALDQPEGNLRRRFARELDWLFQANEPGAPVAATGKRWPADLANIQGGILEGWRGVTHGALVLMSFESPACGARFLDQFGTLLSTAKTNHDVARGKIVYSIAMTLEGLHALGSDASLLDSMPEEFRQGMIQRAGLLGDVRGNHPDRWRPPLRYRGKGRVSLDAVHAVIQIRTNVADDDLIGVVDTKDPRHPLKPAIEALDKIAAGARVTGVEPMRRLYRNPSTRDGAYEHFGYADGMGQPQIAKSIEKPDYDGNVLPVGELLLGYPNSADESAPQNAAPCTAPGAESDWLIDGSFLVIRKYRQHIDRFERAIGSVVSSSAPIDPEIVAGALMGRDRQGHPLVDKSITSNAFDYFGDKSGAVCPLQSHIRRGNPREEATTGKRPAAGSREARIMRRGLSYGPTLAEDPAATERGLVFMAYNASIGEQFEVVQRWMVGGNSTGSSSGMSCPLLGVPEGGRRRHFAFTDGGVPLRVELDGHGPLFEDPEPMIQLEWGSYLWVPSLASYRKLVAMAAAQGANGQTSWDLARGRRLLANLLERTAAGACPHAGVLAWKAALEDVESMSSFDAASIWAAIRADHHGVLRTPFGVLVGEHETLHKTLTAPAGTLSVCGYQHRMRDSLGEIYLGLDDDGPSGRYQSESTVVNQAIGLLKQGDAFELARDAVLHKIDALVSSARAQADTAKATRYEASFEPRELFDEVLAQLCEVWCGLTEASGRFERGTLRWNWKPGQPPSYPGHFTAPSRHIFQAHPGPDVEDFGGAHGKAIRAAFHLLIEDWKSSGQAPTQPLAKAVFEHPLAKNDTDFAARTLAGTVMGFVPTLDGAMRAFTHEWLRDGTFWSLRASHGGSAFSLTSAKTRLLAPLQRALQLRAVPDMIWRTATTDLSIGPETVKAGERIVLGLASAAQQMLASGRPDAERSMFGGVRRTGGPTHSCPGYDAALGALLGAAAGLIATKHELMPVHGTGGLHIEGNVDQRQAPPVRRGYEPSRNVMRINAVVWAAMGTVMVWGDSWINKFFRISGNFASQLKVAGFEVPGGIGSSYDFDDGRYLWLSNMAADASNDPDLLRKTVKQYAPKAILLSGGGNDTAAKTLLRLVNPKGHSDGPLKVAEVAKFVHEELRDHYLTVIKTIQSTPGLDGVIPVVLHGYDHPLPKKGGAALGAYLCDTLNYSEPEAAAIMKKLINELNKMMAGLPAMLQAGKVTHVDLTGQIASSNDPKVGWANELHPTPEGFALLSQRIVAAL